MSMISGGISGAISNPMSPEAQLHAYKYYEEIRHRKDDIYKIAKYTGYTPEQISHELMEMELINNGMSQDLAHEKTSEKYDYPGESNKFYEKLQKQRKATIGKADIEAISGGIRHNVRDDWNLCL